MARIRFLLIPSISIFLTLSTGRAPAAAAQDDVKVNNALALQQAMASAQHALNAGDAKKAVDVLEKELPRVNGNAAFLRLLREAYRALIKDLWLAKNGADAKLYLERLCILEPTAANDTSLRPPDVTMKNAPPEPRPNLLSSLPKYFPSWASSNAKKDTAPAKGATARAKVTEADDDPFSLANMRADTALAATGFAGPPSGQANPQARQFLSRAEEAFARERYAEARQLYEQAYQADKACVNASRERWAYCMLEGVAKQLNQQNQKGIAFGELEQQVRGALALAPTLDGTGKYLLKEISERANVPGSHSSVGVQHRGRNREGWQVAETRYFRIFHHQSPEQVEKIAAIVEQTRGDMFRKWFGTDGADWSTKCELILHPTGSDYSRMTGESAASPGHSRIDWDPSHQRIVGRRMDMRCDNPGMVEAVLPHEATHVVLAGMFETRDVPRWADEGIAVLTEPSYKVDQHRRNLEKSRQEGTLFRVQELMQLDDYPQPRRIPAFYAQSVCLVEFMTLLRGPQIFTAFIRDGLRQGYEASLRTHYGMEMNALQERWQQHIEQGISTAARR